MPLFDYVAKDKTGKIHRGQAEAADEKTLSQQLKQNGLWLTQASSEKTSNPNAARAGENQDKLKVGTLVGLVLAVLRCAYWYFFHAKSR